MALNSKSKGVEEEGWNTMAADEKSKYARQSPVWCFGVAAVCLGLFLLIVIFGFVAHNASAIRHRNILQVSLVKCENQIYNLTTDRDALKQERDQLKINSSRLAKEMEVLQTKYSTAAMGRDMLQQEVNRLNHSLTSQVCKAGWVKFNNKCYYVSEKGQTKTWEESRRDCLERRSNLVIITTKEELAFVVRMNDRSWIGLSDTQREGTWKWVDGSDLVGKGFWQSGEPNNAGNEDCVEISRANGNWNDALCTSKIPWICED